MLQSRRSERSKQSAEPTSNPVQGGRPPAAAAPKPAPTGPSLSAAYASALQVDAQHLVAANGARTTTCATSRDLASCRSALQQVASAATALQHDLDAHPAPACIDPMQT